MAETGTPTRTTFLVVGSRPLLVIDLGGRRGAAAELAPELAAFVERGMALLPGLFEIPIPASSSLVFSRVADGWELREGPLHALMLVPDADVPAAWADAVEELEGVLVLVGCALNLDAAVEVDAAVVRLSDAARESRLVGSLVELA